MGVHIAIAHLKSSREGIARIKISVRGSDFTSLSLSRPASPPPPRAKIATFHDGVSA